jgi:serine/threonine-protein phosphatase 2B regulatory subunit
MGNNLFNASDPENTLSFTKQELKILYKNFNLLDTDKSGKIEPNEFFDVPELKDNPIVNKVISAFDKDKDGKISFYEFVSGLSILADDMKKEDKYRFAFNMYDTNSDGYITNGDLYTTLKLLVGDNLDEIQIQQVVDRTIIMADKDYDGRISYEEFVEFVQTMNLHKILSVNIFDFES